MPKRVIFMKCIDFNQFPANDFSGHSLAVLLLLKVSFGFFDLGITLKFHFWLFWTFLFWHVGRHFLSFIVGLFSFIFVKSIMNSHFLVKNSIRTYLYFLIDVI